MSGILWPTANLIVVPPLVCLEWRCCGFQNVPIRLRVPGALQTCPINALTGSGQSLFVCSPNDLLKTQKTCGRNKSETHRCPKSFGLHTMRREVSAHRCPKFFELHIMPREVGAHSEVTNNAPSNAMDQQWSPVHQPLCGKILIIYSCSRKFPAARAASDLFHPGELWIVFFGACEPSDLLHACRSWS